MDEDRQANLTFALMLLLALWLGAYGYSVVVLLSAPPRPGTVALASRSTSGFLGWQGVAGMLAFGCWGIGWGFEKGSDLRRISAVPIVLAAALVLVLLGMVLFGR